MECKIAPDCAKEGPSLTISQTRDDLSGAQSGNTLQYSQPITNLESLVSEYERSLAQIAPLKEHNVLFLLLSEFAQLSNAEVYVEIRREGEMQIFDSTIEEPPALTYQNSESPESGIPSSETATQHSLRNIDSECRVTINFPDLFPIQPVNDVPLLMHLDEDIPADIPPTYREAMTVPHNPLPGVSGVLQRRDLDVRRCCPSPVTNSEQGDTLPPFFLETVSEFCRSSQNVSYLEHAVPNLTLKVIPCWIYHSTISQFRPELRNYASI